MFKYDDSSDESILYSEHVKPLDKATFWKRFLNWFLRKMGPWNKSK